MIKFHSLFTIVILTGLSSQVLAHDEDKDEAKREYEVKLIPLNNSGVQGEVEIKVMPGNRLVVEIEADGLEPGKIHPQHIHGFNLPVKKSSCPDFNNDTNGDGIVAINEAAPVFGPIIVPLVPFDTVDAKGEIDYEASFSINPASIEPLGKRTVVLHGMTVNGEYIASLPVACGEIVLDE
ncbi:MAG: superoxide dismutase family protein [Gammaproteobacteria bacterium]|nr:superoxide dismutase family protein [Gammaproteobacteria bacterium]